MPIRTLRLVPSGRMAASLIARAKLQAREGVAPFKAFRTGLPSLDAIPSWWGVTTIVGPDAVANRALAVRVALEAAKSGENVLWLCIAGNSEGAALRMVAGAAGIQTRRVFVDRDLTASDWAALKRSVRRFSRLPIQFADGHGATIGDISAAFASASRRVSGRSACIDLVVIDGLEIPDRALLSGIEHLAENTNTPFLVVGNAFTREFGNPQAATLSLPLRPESLVLDLRTSAPRQPNADAGSGAQVHIRLFIGRIGRCQPTTAHLRYSSGSHWIEEWPLP